MGLFGWGNMLLFLFVFVGIIFVFIFVLGSSEFLHPVLPFLLTNFLTIHQLNIFPNAPTDISPHLFPKLRCEWHILFFLFGIIKTSGCLNCVAMRNIGQNDCPCCCLFALRHPEQTAVVTKHFGSLGKEFWENTSAVVVRLPNFILWAV